jgi:hypothetical protein
VILHQLLIPERNEASNAFDDSVLDSMLFSPASGLECAKPKPHVVPVPNSAITRIIIEYVREETSSP